MINYDTVLSTFDDKLTLLQWLQKVEQALEGAGLERVEISQPTPTTAIFKFVFADGTSVTTPSVTLPRGAKGDTGATGATGATGNGIASITKTGTSGLIDTYTILYTNGSTQTFTVTNGAQGEAGQDGTDGVGVSNMTIASNTGVVTVTYTDGNSDTIGNVYSIVGITGTSGTISSAETLLKLGNKNTYVDPTGKNLMYYVKSDSTNHYYRSIEIDTNSENITQADFTCNKTTGAWTYVETIVTRTIEAGSIDSETATNGQVLTADGNGGASWQDASGGGDKYYNHCISIGYNGSDYKGTIKLNWIRKTSTAISSISNFMTALNNAGYNSNVKVLVCTGLFYDVNNSASLSVLDIKRENGSNIGVHYIKIGDANATVQQFNINVSYPTFSDTPVEII